jgi:hypothetical protein
MKPYSNIVFPDLTRRLVATGILPVYAQDAAITHPAPDWLQISQEGGFLENRIFELDHSSGTGCILSLSLAVERSAFSIWGWELDLPWKDHNFQLLSDPQGRESPDYIYKIPDSQSESYSRDLVINDCSQLLRGHPLEGFLLGFSLQPIPASDHQGKRIDARLVIIDEMRRSYFTTVQLYVDRSAKFDRQRGKEKIRKSIFDQLVDGEDVLKDEEDVLIQQT